MPAKSVLYMLRPNRPLSVAALIIGCPTPVVGKVAFPVADGKFLLSGVEEENQ